jgi:hypothetical protein
LATGGVERLKLAQGIVHDSSIVLCVVRQVVAEELEWSTVDYRMEMSASPLDDGAMTTHNVAPSIARAQICCPQVT